MKAKILLILVLLSFCNTSFAEIITKKEGKSLVVEFYRNGAEVTMEVVEADFRAAMEEAIRQKCNIVGFRKNDGLFFSIIKGKSEIRQIDKHFELLKETIASMTAEEHIKGEVIRSQRIRVSGPKYRSETYKNGKLEDVYESDWDAGYFKSETSTYQTSGAILVTKTFYVPEKYETMNTYGPGHTIVIPGIVKFAEEVYSD